MWHLTLLRFFFPGLAFHPLDGILQAVPHVVALFIVPIHFTTHLGLLFMEAIWTANIHDCIHGNIWPVMGAGYHTIHHTTYKHNYGHYTIWMDWMFGSLRDPLLEEVDNNKDSSNKAEWACPVFSLCLLVFCLFVQSFKPFTSCVSLNLSNYMLRNIDCTFVVLFNSGKCLVFKIKCCGGTANKYLTVYSLQQEISNLEI